MWAAADFLLSHSLILSSLSRFFKTVGTWRDISSNINTRCIKNIRQLAYIYFSLEIIEASWSIIHEQRMDSRPMMTNMGADSEATCQRDYQSEESFRQWIEHSLWKTTYGLVGSCREEEFLKALLWISRQAQESELKKQ